jgi:hypothetical protein
VEAVFFRRAIHDQVSRDLPHAVEVANFTLEIAECFGVKLVDLAFRDGAISDRKLFKSCRLRPRLPRAGAVSLTLATVCLEPMSAKRLSSAGTSYPAKDEVPKTGLSSPPRWGLFFWASEWQPGQVAIEGGRQLRRPKV